MIKNRILLLLIFICTFAFANCVATEMIRVKCKTSEDLILWVGYGCPEQFDLYLVKNNISRKEVFENGLKLCEEKAKDGIREYQEILGIYYYSEKNEFRKGLYWLTKCVSQGSSRGMFILFYAYAKGLGVVQNEDECFKWLYLAAAAGDEEAVKYLNALHEQFGFSEKTMQQGKKNAQVWMQEHSEIFFNPN